MNIMVILWVVVAMVFYTTGEYFSKKYANTSLKQFALIAWLGYSINAFCFLPAISKFNSLSILGTIWNVLYVIITFFIGIIIFKESLSITQFVGLGFALVAIILLSI